jgi:hypothetical protein
MRDLDLLIDWEKKVEDILSEVENLSEKRKEEGYST